MMVYITPPKGLTVLTPVVSNLAFTNQGNTMRASWTLITSQTGSYPLTITAHSNSPIDTQTFSVTVNVGSPGSLTLTGLNIPGNIFPNDNFTVGIKLKNVAIVPDSNILAQIFVPAGLQLLDNATKYSSSINSNQEIIFDWKLKAENPGSYVVLFNYTSANAGSGSTSAGVNIGTRPVATGALLSIMTEPTTLRQNSINPVVMDITNNGVQDVHNLQIISASGGGYVSTNTPAWIGDLIKGAKKTVTLQIDTSNGTLPLQIPVSVKYDSNGNSFTETYQTGLQLENKPDFKINSVMASPSLSYAGDTADKLVVQIFNAGIGTNDVYATLNLPQGLSSAWGGATSAYFGRIDTFQTVTATFFVNVDSKAISGNYPLSMVVTSGQEKTNLNLNFIVAPKALFNLVSADSSQLYPGAANVPFKIILRNDGTSAAQTITTKLLSGNSVPGVKSITLTTVGNIENIGTVLPSQVFTTTFLVNLDPTFTSGDQATSVEIDWTQNGTNSFVQTVAVPYHVASGPYYLLYYNGIPWTYVMVAGFLGFCLYFFIRKRRQRMRVIESALLQERSMRSEKSLEFPNLELTEDISAIKENEPVHKTKEIPKKEASKTTHKGEDTQSKRNKISP
jgi:hypothetical protein